MAQHKIQLLHKQHGDLQKTWDPEIQTPEAQAEIEEAKKMFDDHVGKGWFAANVDPATKQGEMIQEFDAKYENIVMYPMAAGGS